jgi:hypothetical protein
MNPWNEAKVFLTMVNRANQGPGNLNIPSASGCRCGGRWMRSDAPVSHASGGSRRPGSPRTYSMMEDRSHGFEDTTFMLSAESEGDFIG